MFKHAIRLIGALLVIGQVCAVDAIPADRSIDWSQAGVPGGIPSAGWTIRQTLSPSGGDDTAAIQNALSAAPAHSVIQLNQGTYHLTGFSQNVINSQVVLRGAGPDKTVLEFGASGYRGLGFGSDAWPQFPANLIFAITSGADKGSTSIVSPGAGSAHVGDLMQISQLNGTFGSNTLPSGTITVTGVGSEGTSNPSGDRDRNNTRNLMQMVRVTAISGNVISFAPALYWTYLPGLSPQLALAPSTIRQVGIEDLKLDNVHATSPPQALVSFTFADQCWLRNVELAHGKWAALFFATLNCEIRDSYIHDVFQDNYTVNNGYFELQMSGAYLVENNIINNMYTPFMTEGGNCGGVVGYNYIVNTHGLEAWMLGDSISSNHAAHPMFNLYEGNMAAAFQPDNYYGSSSHGVVFRNHLLGTDNNVSWNQKAVSLDARQLYYTVVGNVLGTAPIASGWDPSSAQATTWAYEKTDTSYLVPAIFRLGYSHIGNNGLDGLDAQVKATLLRGGNYEYSTHAVVWRSNAPDSPSTYLIQQALPASLYRASRPAWFGTTPWPAIGPDVSGGTDQSGHACDIPAKRCFAALGLAAGETFNASYYAEQPAAPTITAFTPASGLVGSAVIITGTGFTDASAVTFNGIAATYAVGSATSITSTVPAGADSGPITVTTPGGTATSATFTITMVVNHAPVANAQSVTTAEGTATAIILVAGDSDGDPLAYAIVTGPAHGALSGSGASRAYSPIVGYSGSDSFTFVANDGTADSNTAIVSITVMAGGASTAGARRSSGSGGGGCGSGAAGLLIGMGVLLGLRRRRRR